LAPCRKAFPEIETSTSESKLGHCAELDSERGSCLGTDEFIRRWENLVFVESIGAAKSDVASAIGQ
jgi:hypothetical protein